MQAHHTLISANVLRIIAKLGLIKMVDQNLIEHDAHKVTELAHSEQLRQIKPADFLFDVEEARQIFEQPILVFKNTDTSTTKKQTQEQEMLPKKDPIDLFIEKLYSYMKSSK